MLANRSSRGSRAAGKRSSSRRRSASSSGLSSPRASKLSPGSISATSTPSTAARSSAMPAATACGETGVSVAMPDRSAANRFSACARSCSGVRADRTMACGAGAGAALAGPSRHSSTITCALAPPAPKEEMPAIRGPSARHSAACRWSAKGVAARSRLGLTVSACRVGANMPWRICRITLVSPAMPAAASRCPMADFTDPSAQKPVSAVSGAKAWVRPSTSMGSPSTVPVPCASI